MRSTRFVHRFVLAVTFVVAFTPLLLGQQYPSGEVKGKVEAASASGAKPITIEDYARFKRLGGAAISADGKWMLYTVTPNDGDGTMFVQSLDSATTHEIPRGTGASFSDTSRWVAYFVAPPAGRGGRGNAGRGGGAQAPATGGQGAAAQAPQRTFEILDLTTGTKTSFPAVASFSFSPNGEWVLLRPQAANAPAAADPNAGRGGGRAGGAPVDNASQPGTDLLMRNLATGDQRYVGNVGAFTFDDAGALMAYTVRGQSRLGNGVYVMTLGSGETKMLDTAAADYDQLAWSDKGTNLAVLRGDKARDRLQKDNVLLAWTNAGSPNARMTTVDPAKSSSFPAGMVISEFTAPRWSSDGARILVGVKAQEPDRPASTATEPAANVDVWHWKDERPQSQQMITVNQDRRSTFAAVVDLASGAVRQIANDDMRTITPTDDLKWAVGRIDTPYRGQIAWGGSKADVYRVNLLTGEKTIIEPALSRTMGSSPDGKWFLYLQKSRVYSYDMATGKKTAIDGGRSFLDAEDDHDYEKPVYGVAGFSADGKSALLYDRYDLWSLPLAGGTPVNVTKGAGAKQEVRLRVAPMRPTGAGGGGGRGGGAGAGGNEGIDLTKPITFSAYGEFTKKTGYFGMAPGQAPQPLIWADKAIGAPIVAKNADRVIFTQQTFNEYPNYWVSTKEFGAPRQVTDADPDLLKQFAWGSKKLIDYTNSKGQKLQATLTLPAGYEPGKRYPMLVYFYEIMSNTHHNFQIPPYDDRPHMATYASNGYLVLQPDVVYEIGKPGSSALDCVGSAVKKVIELGYADPKKVGLQGHSWGGYQSSFLVTATDMFAAVVTGAPPTDLTSFYGTLYRSTGTIQQGITEVGQVRMGENVTPWSHHALYESQSPIHNAPNIKTPFLILHGTADGAVDWGQGLEFYAAARRLGKQVILLSYPEEAHHLGRKENQIDFQIRMRQFFDHYLKGAPAPEWMTKGVPQVMKGTR
ncbi:MAG TPA: prolyl oligopeptidase family serine peptidase [Vicinamibacterales bacterium]|nr:prolyl oligopeptidase family serine peptidase [Vicinamibacterales bacterium]